MYSLRLRGLAFAITIILVLSAPIAYGQSQDFTSTLILCETSFVHVGESVACAAIVTNISGSTSPVGFANMIRIGSGDGFFEDGAPAGFCELEPKGTGRSECEFSYTATRATDLPSEDGNHIILGTFLGNGAHAASSGTTQIRIKLRTSQVALICSQDSILVGEEIQCTAEVSTAHPQKSPFITGFVVFTTEGLGGLQQCVLVIDTITSSCSISFTAVAPADSGRIEAKFLGSDQYQRSASELPIEKLTRSTKTEIRCDSTQPKLGEPVNCSVWVGDSAEGIASQPSGAIQVRRLKAQDGNSALVSECTLTSADEKNSSCEISFYPRELGKQSYHVQFVEKLNTHNESETSITLDVQGESFTERNQTHTEIDCTTSSLQVGKTTSCEARVSLAGQKGTLVPLGEVVFNSDFSADQFSTEACRLARSSTGARCQISFTAMESVGERILTAEYIGTHDLQPSRAEVPIDITPIQIRFTHSFLNAEGNRIQLLKAQSSTAIHLQLEDPDGHSLPDGTEVRFSVSQGALENGKTVMTTEITDGKAVVTFNTLGATGTTSLVALVEDTIYSGRFSKTFIIQGECTDDCPSEIVPELIAALFIPIFASRTTRQQLQAR